MTEHQLPQPVTEQGLYLAAILDELRLIGDRLPAKPEPLPAGRVELTEPAAPVPAPFVEPALPGMLDELVDGYQPGPPPAPRPGPSSASKRTRVRERG